MTMIAYTSDPLGFRYSPPTFRLYVAPVQSCPRGGVPGQAEWFGETFAEYWSPVSLSWGVGGRPSELCIRRVLGAGPGRSVAERADAVGLANGMRVRLVEVQNAGSTGLVQREWFRGCVGRSRVLVDASEAGEVCEAVAYGPELLLGGKCVSGQWHAVQSVADALAAGANDSASLCRTSTFRSNLPVVFNANGLPNAGTAAWRLDTRGLAATPGGAVFDAPGHRVCWAGRVYEACSWNPATAVRSLVEMIDDYGVISPSSISEMPAELAGLMMGEVRVEGMSVLDAIAAVLRSVGYGYCIEPWADRRGRHALRVFDASGLVSGSRVRRPVMAPIDGAAARACDDASQRAEVRRIEFVRDGREVFNDVTVVGSQVRRQVSLSFGPGGGELMCAWDGEAHDLANWASDEVVDPLKWGDSTSCTAAEFDRQYTYGAASGVDGRHAFRSFAWNEDGSLVGVTGAMGDLSPVDSSGRAVRRPRPVGSTLVRDDSGTRVRNIGAQVLLGIAGDDNSWIQVPAVIWADRAGFTLPINPLWRWYPYACDQARNIVVGDGETLFDRYGRYGYLTLLNNALSGLSPALTLKLVGSVECDCAVVGRAPRRTGTSWPIVSARVVRVGSRLRKSEVPTGSDPFGLSVDRHDVRDDSAEAAAMAAQLRSGGEEEVGRGSIMLRQVTRAYVPGDVIPGTRGRRIDLTAPGSRGSRAPIVTGVEWDFAAGDSRTELVLG